MSRTQPNRIRMATMRREDVRFEVVPCPNRVTYIYAEYGIVCVGFRAPRGAGEWVHRRSFSLAEPLTANLDFCRNGALHQVELLIPAQTDQVELPSSDMQGCPAVCQVGRRSGAMVPLLNRYRRFACPRLSATVDESRSRFCVRFVRREPTLWVTAAEGLWYGLDDGVLCQVVAAR